MRKVAHLHLSGNNLSGEIPLHINISLPNLRKLFLQFNNLRGDIPDSIGYLKHLRYLNLQGNPLTGNIPSTIRFLRELETFMMGDTKVKGFDKDAYFNSKQFVHFNAWKAKKFNCSFQQLMQALRSTKSSLVSINMENSQLHGQLTSEIFQFSRLVSIHFASCQLKGQLPDSVTSFKEIQSLTKIILRGNHLRGTIPSSYSNQQNLFIFDLRGNKEMHGDLDGQLRTDYHALIKEGGSTEYYCPTLRFSGNGGYVYTDSSFYHRKYCFCDKGYYGLGGTCKKCMDGGICEGYSLRKQNAKGTSNTGILQTEMVLRSGYWPFKSWQNVTRLVKCSDFSMERELCNRTGRCACSLSVVMTPYSEDEFLQTACNKTCICAAGHTGRFCSQCLNGHFKNGATCVPCPESKDLQERTVLTIFCILAPYLCHYLSQRY